MNIERIVYLKRSLKYGVNKNIEKLVDELIKSYYEDLVLCCHNTYYDNGYYKLHNNEIYKTDREHAEIRSLICPVCQKEIILIKTKNVNWDVTINNNPISVYQKDEQSKKYVLTI